MYGHSSDVEVVHGWWNDAVVMLGNAEYIQEWNKLLI